MAPLTLTVTGRASKRGLIPRQPPADRLIAGIETWLRLEYPDLVRSSRTRTSSTGDRELLVGLHPAAEEFSIAASDDGDVTISARLDPGRSRLPDVRRAARPADRARARDHVGRERRDGQGGSDLAAAGDRTSVEQSYLTWLGAL